MTSAHLPIFIVLLLLPNSTWHDWKIERLLYFHAILMHSAIGVMNNRTAETDKITTEGGVRSLFASARMLGSGDIKQLKYTVDPDNLREMLTEQKISVIPQDPFTTSLIGPSAFIKNERGKFLVETVSLTSRTADSEIARMQRLVAEHDGILIIAATNPTPKEYKKFDQLAPIAFWSNNQAPGLIDSESTRIPGLITNTDFAPTVATLVGGQLPGPSYGIAADTHKFDKKNQPTQLDYLEGLGQTQATQQLSAPYFAVAISVTIILCTLALLRRETRYCYPLSILTLLIVIWVNTVGLLQLFLLLSIISVAVIFRNSQNSDITTLYSSGSIVCATLYDTVFNQGQELSNSIMGFNILDGSRYYGLGNEAMGLLIGATAVFTSVLQRMRVRAFWGKLIWLIVAVILGHPQFGAKAGGLVVAFVCLAAYPSLQYRGKLLQNIRGVLGNGVVGIVIALLSLIGLSHFGHSHVSQNLTITKSSGTASLISVIYRKGWMDLHLMLHSLWMITLITGAISLWMVFTKVQPESNISRDETLTLGIVATLSCLIFNDAGVVAAAVCSTIVWGYLMLRVYSA